MPERKQRDTGSADQAREIEASQDALRQSIAEVCQLIEQATELTRRHRHRQGERIRP
jgi:hypothetical protein